MMTRYPMAVLVIACLLAAGTGAYGAAATPAGADTLQPIFGRCSVIRRSFA